MIRQVSSSILWLLFLWLWGACSPQQAQKSALPIVDMAGISGADVIQLVRVGRFWYPEPKEGKGMLGPVWWFRCAEDGSICVTGFERSDGTFHFHAWDGSGNYLYSIFSGTEGPAAFHHPSDIQIQADTLAIMDRIRKEVLYFRLRDGSFVGRKSLAFAGRQFAPVGGSEYIGRGNAWAHDSDLPRFPWNLVRDGHAQERAVWIRPSMRDRFFHFGGFMKVMDTDEQLLFLNIANDTIFSVDERGIRPLLVVRPPGFVATTSELDRLDEMARKTTGPDPRRDMQLLGWLNQPSNTKGMECLLYDPLSERMIVTWTRNSYRGLGLIAHGKIKDVIEIKDRMLTSQAFQANSRTFAFYIPDPLTWIQSLEGKTLPEPIEAIAKRLPEEEEANPLFLFLDLNDIWQWRQ